MGRFLGGLCVNDVVLRKIKNGIELMNTIKVEKNEYLDLISNQEVWFAEGDTSRKIS